MTLAELYNQLKSINGLNQKVAYDRFNTSQALPFAVFYESHTYNFAADNKVYISKTAIIMELYTSTKNTELETNVETILNTNELIWGKSSEYLEDNKCYQITYTFEI